MRGLGGVNVRGMVVQSAASELRHMKDFGFTVEGSRSRMRSFGLRDVIPSPYH